MSRQFIATAMWYVEGPFTTTAHDGRPYTADILENVQATVVVKDRKGDFFVRRDGWGFALEVTKACFGEQQTTRLFRDHWRCWDAPGIVCGDDGLPTFEYGASHLSPYARSLFCGKFTRIF